MAWTVTSALPAGHVTAAWTEPASFACSDPAVEALVLATAEVAATPTSAPEPFDLANPSHVALAWDEAMATVHWDAGYRRSANVWTDDDPPPAPPPIPEGVTP